MRALAGEKFGPDRWSVRRVVVYVGHGVLVVPLGEVEGDRYESVHVVFFAIDHDRNVAAFFWFGGGDHTKGGFEAAEGGDLWFGDTTFGDFTHFVCVGVSFEIIWPNLKKIKRTIAMMNNIVSKSLLDKAVFILTRKTWIVICKTPCLGSVFRSSSTRRASLLLSSCISGACHGAVVVETYSKHDGGKIKLYNFSHTVKKKMTGKR